jgi:hypothetical protein
MDEQRGYLLSGVKEHGEGYAVELVCRTDTGGRISIRARNEGGNNDTLVDLWDLVDWLRFGPEPGRTDVGFYLPIDGQRGDT